MNQVERFQRLTCTQAVRSDLRGKSVRAFSASWAAGAVDFVLRLGSTAILARIILPEYFGLVMMATAITAIADQFRDLGLSTATVQKSDITHQEVSNLFWINTVIGISIALFICALSPLISLYYADPRLTPITCILATNFIWGGLMVQHQALLARVLQLGHTALVRVTASLLSTILAVYLAWRGFGYWALIWREVFRSALLTIGMWICLPWVPSLPCRKTNVRELLGFGAHLSAANIVVTIASSLDRILIGRFWGAAPVALYRQAYQLLVLPMDQLLSPMFNVTQPGLSMLQNDDVRYRCFYEKVLKIVCIVTMPASLFVAANATEITRVVLGKKWLDCATVLSALALGTFIKSPVSWSGIILITRGHSKKYLHLALAQNAMRILLILIGVQWGIIGVAVADVASTWLMAPATLYFGFKDSPVSLRSFFSASALPAVSSIVMVVVLRFFHQLMPSFGAPLFLAISSLVALATFTGTWLLLPGGKADLKVLFSDVLALRRSKSNRVAQSSKSSIAASQDLPA